MPYENIWEEKGVRSVLTGEVTDEELINCNMEIYAHPRFLEIEYELGDFLGTTKFNISSDTVRRVAAMDAAASRRNPNIRVAIVATELVIVGMARMWSYSGGSSVWDAEVFGDMETARNWLGIQK